MAKKKPNTGDPRRVGDKKENPGTGILSKGTRKKRAKRVEPEEQT